MEVSFILSGEDDYAPGAFSLSIPKTMFKDRSNRPIGTVHLSVPEAPDKSQLFAYIEEQDSYRIINTRTLKAASAGRFEVSIRELSPPIVKDYVTSYKTSDFKAQLQITTKKGSRIGKETTALQAQVDTSATLQNADKKAISVYSIWQKDFPDELKPAKVEDYVYTKWRISATSKASQPFKVSIKEETSVKDNPNAKSVILGYYFIRENKVIKGKAVDDSQANVMEASVFDGFVEDGRNFEAIVYTAYKKSDLKLGNEYKFNNTCTYTLEAQDDQNANGYQKSVATASSEISFVYQDVILPTGHFIVNKHGYGKKINSENNKLQEGIYVGALNELKEGKDVATEYFINSYAFGMPWTFKGTKDEIKDLSKYGQNPYKLEVIDDKLLFNGNENTPLKGDKDYNFVSLRLFKPFVYNYEQYQTAGYGFREVTEGYYKDVTYGKVPAGSWAYRLEENSKDSPDMFVYAKKTTGDYIKCATIHTKDGKIVIEATNGASVDNKQPDVLNFPNNTVAYKVITETKKAALIWYMYPKVKFYAKGNFQQKVKDAFDNADKPTLKVTNYAKMNLEALENGKKINKFINDYFGNNVLQGVSYGAKLTKTLTYENDNRNNAVILHYKAKATVQTNITDKADLAEFVEKGVFEEQKEATFYDLLPKGVVVKENTIALRPNDWIESVDTIPNYKESGRTLLIVKAKLQPDYKYKSVSESILLQSGLCDEPQISFDAVYSFVNYKANGKALTNNIVYESANKRLGTIKHLMGEPDDPTKGNNDYSKDATSNCAPTLTNLNDKHDNPSFIYAKAEVNLTVDLSTLVGLSKNVDVNDENFFGSGLDENTAKNVYEGGRYVYLISMQNADNTAAKGIKFFDKLEQYVPTKEANKEDYNDQTFRGIFDYVDVKSLEAKGIKPVVYYSTTANLLLDDNNNRKHTDLTDSTIWQTQVPADKSKITAIAIDCSKASDGTEYTLPLGESMSAYVYMKAPYVKNLETNQANYAKWYDQLRPDNANESDSKDGGLAYGAHAYNNISMLITDIPKGGQPKEPRLMHNEYTKVGLKPFKLTILKEWEDDNDRDGKRPAEAKIKLLASGKEYKELNLNANNNWQVTLENCPYLDEQGNKIRYSISEVNVPQGYEVRYLQPRETKDGFEYKCINKYEPELISVPVKKIWQGGVNPEAITLSLLADGVLLKKQTITKDDNWQWTFKDLYKYKKVNDKSVEISYTVEEAEVPAGYIKTITGDASKGYTVTNKYSPYGDIKISKKVQENTLKYIPQTKLFKFKLTILTDKGEEDNSIYDYETEDKQTTGKISSGGVLEIKANTYVTVKNVHSEYKYEVTEIMPPGYTQIQAQALTGEVKAGKTNDVQVTNKYYAETKLPIVAHKNLLGQKLEAYKFVFKIYDEQGNERGTASNLADGTIPFGSLTFSLDDVGKTYSFTIKEVNNKLPGYTYDASQLTFTIKVEDNGDGTLKLTPTYPKKGLTFTNKYEAKGEIELVAWKKLSNGEMPTAGLFDFELKDDKGNVIATAKNDKTGVIKFKLNYTQDDINKTYTYTANEVKPNDASDYTYDTHACQYTVKVHDKGDGTLGFDLTAQDLYTEDFKNDKAIPVFYNIPKPGSLKVTKAFDTTDKNVDYKQHVNKEFKFKLKFSGVGADKLKTLNLERSEYKPATSALSSLRSSFTDLLSAVRNFFAPTNEPASNAVEGENEPKKLLKLSDALGDAGALMSNEPNSSENANANESPKLSTLAEPKLKLLAESAESAESLVKPELLTAPESLAKPAPLSAKPKARLASLHANSLNNVASRSARAATITGHCGYFDDNAAQFSYDPNTKVLKITGYGNNNVYPIYWFLEDDNNEWYASVEEIQFDNNCHFDFTDKNNFENDAANNFGFDYMPKLKKVTFGRNIFTKTSSLESLFKGREQLQTVAFNDTDMSKITNMSQMFAQCPKLANVQFNNCNMGNVTSMYAMFYGCSSLTNVEFNNCIMGNVTSMCAMFYGCSSLTNVKFNNCDTSKVTDMSHMFRGCSKLTSLDVSKWNTINVTNMGDMFNGCSSLTSLDVSKWNTGNVTNMKNMFANCSKLTSLGTDNVKNWNTGKVTNMKYMFANCSKLTSLDVGSWNTEKVTDMEAMFANCSSLTSLGTDSVKNWNTGKVTNMKNMFANCSKLTSLDVSKWNTGKVTNMETLFYQCSSLTTLDVSKWNTSRLTTTYFMFGDCKKLTTLDVSKWNTANVTDMSSMFSGCESLATLDLGSFNTANVTNKEQMFYDCKKLSKLTLGDKVTSIKGTALPNIDTNTNTDYTGEWIKDDKTIKFKSSEEFTKNFDGSKDHGTYVWEKKADTEYTLKFDANGGTGSMADVKVKVGTNYTMPACTFTRLNYKFKYWNTQQNGQGTMYIADTNYSNLATADATLTLYAIWEEEKKDINIANGEATFTLKANEAVTIKDIPAGVNYEVYEESAEKGWVLVEQKNTTGKISSNQTAESNFINAYKVGQTSAVIKATKLLDAVGAAGFKFGLYEGEKLLQEATSKDGGIITFKPIIYAKAGKHTYTIKEIIPEPKDSSMTYDENSQTVICDVTDDSQGNLTAMLDKTKESLVFKNVHKKGSLTIKKELTNASDKSKDVMFSMQVMFSTGVVEHIELKNGETKTFNDLPIGTTYEVKELNIPSGYDLVEISNATGTIGEKGVTVTVKNNYKLTGSVDIALEKELKDAENKAKELQGGEFEFILLDNENNTLATAKNDKEGKINFGSIKLTKAGIFTWQAKEVKGKDPNITYDDKEIKIKVEAQDKGDGTLTVTVTYPNGKKFTNKNIPPKPEQKGKFTIHKEVKFANGGTLSEASQQKAFKVKISLKILDPKTNKLVDLEGQYDFTSTKQQNGVVKNESEISIKHDETITVNNLPIGTEVSVTELATTGYKLDQANSVLTGTIVAPTKVEAEAKSELGTATELAASGAKAEAEAANTAEATATTEADATTEAAAEATTDNATETAPNLKLNLVNIYEPKGSLKLEGDKGLIGKNIALHSFNFKVIEDGNILQSVKNDTSGKIAFKEINYTLDDVSKEHTYKIVEERGNDEHIAYDRTEYTVKVQVTDDGNGKLIAELKEGTPSKLTFTNRYRHSLPTTGKEHLIIASVIGTSLLLLALYLIKKKDKGGSSD